MLKKTEREFRPVIVLTCVFLTLTIVCAAVQLYNVISCSWNNTSLQDPPQRPSMMNMTLGCRLLKPEGVVGFKWVNPELLPYNVFAYQYGSFHGEEQHPSYRNRVFVKDAGLGKADCSIVIINATMKEFEAEYKVYTLHEVTKGIVSCDS